MTLCLMSHRVLLNPPIILLMDPGGIPSDGVKGSPGESQTWGRGAEGRKRPSLLFLASFMLGPPHSGQLVMHFLPLCSYTHPINTQVHMSKQGSKTVCLLLSRGPRACQCIWAELISIKGGDQCCQTSKGQLNSKSQQCEKGFAVYSPGRFSADKHASEVLFLILLV